MDTWRQFHFNYLTGMTRYTKAANVNTLRRSGLGRQPGFMAALCHPCHGPGSLESISSQLLPPLCSWREKVPMHDGQARLKLGLGTPLPPCLAQGSLTEIQGGPAKGKVLLLSHWAGTHRREGRSPCCSGVKDQKSCEPRMGGSILRFQPLVDMS